MTAELAMQRRGRTGRWLAFSVLVLAVLLIAVDATVLSLATPFISRELGPTGTQLLWIGDVYSFVLAGLLVTMGSLGDRIGRKKLLLIGATAFGVASALVAYAPSAELLIAARALLGVAGATLMPSTLALIRNIFADPAERSTAIGIWAAGASAGTAFGPVVGGFLLEHFWWGSVFLINVPVMAVLVPVGLWLLPESRDPAPGPWDPASVALSLIGMIGTVYAIKEAAVHGLRPDIAAAGVVGVGSLIVFARRQLRLPHPLIDVRLFRHRTFTGVVGANLVSVLGLAGLVYFLSQYFQLVAGYAPLKAGLAELPATIASTVSGVLAGALVRRTSMRIALSGGIALTGLAMAALTVLRPDTGYPLLGAALFVLGVGVGIAFTLASDVVLSSVPKEQAGAASAVSETAYELGMALGIATIGSIVTGVYRSAALPAEVRESLATAVDTAARLPVARSAELLERARAAFTDGLAIASGIGAVLLLASAAAIWVVFRDYPDRR
ncbi:MFS transporter [Actinoplanes palleronii]|uniref:MFS transporter n=1 Tax=Actinoplanes palleronii TaxID=113570 RepID=A0ABQ4BI32_9ACTN|nr:MFS transporter [Actinoplanes palleronii]GIE70308.1 MFS transporter [Actinoplanes palleronii]